MYMCHAVSMIISITAKQNYCALYDESMKQAWYKISKSHIKYL